MLTNLIEKGLNKISDKDVEFLANAFAKNLQGTNTQSFRLAEALVKKSGLGLSWRLDAMKDVGYMDEIRSGEMCFGDAMSNVTKVWGNFVKAVKSENPNSNIVAEITDIYQLMQEKKLKRVLFLATGALFSPILFYQKENINSICHAISLEAE